MFRTLIIIVALLLVFLLVKNLLAKKRLQRPLNKPDQTSGNTVQCMQCKTYIPDSEAIIAGQQFFCCQQHKRDWLDTQK